MSILSIEFLAFLAVIIGFYYLLPGKCRPYVLLAGNIFFYLQFDIRFIPFLLFSILSVFFGAWIMEKASARGKKWILGCILLLNIGLLFFVKFGPGLLAFTGISVTILMPLGISFYTLQVCGYLMDVYRGKYPAERSFCKFSAFSTFFPLMLQGPISRYDQLAHQLFSTEKLPHIYENLTYGAQLMLWGFFQKLVIADRAAIFVNHIFANYSDSSGLLLLGAILLYTLQIYTDFSGCVDICRGAAQMLGIEVIDNFRRPYFSRSIQEFWKRWHISLSGWFRDYLYIPLGGNRKGTVRKYLNLIIVFLVSGLWHGVGVHFLVWGLLQAVFQIIGALTLPAKKMLCIRFGIDREGRGYRLAQYLFTFVLINISWLFFRADSTRDALQMFAGIFRILPLPESIPGFGLWDVLCLLGASTVLFMISFFREKGIRIRQTIAQLPLFIRWTIYWLALTFVLLLGIYGPGYSDNAFIYMNF